MVSLRVENWSVVEPVTLQDLKSHLRVTVNTEDTLIGTYLTAARESVENYLGRSLVNKSYVQSHDYFPHVRHAGGYSGFENWHGHDRRRPHPLEMKLLRTPLRKITSIVYTDTSEVRQTLAPRVSTPWVPGVAYFIGDQIFDSNLHIQEVTAVTGHSDGSPNVSGANTPTWSTSAGNVTDQDLIWTDKGLAPAGDFRVYTGEPPRILPLLNQPWPYTLRDVLGAVEIRYVSGYGLDGSYVKSTWKQAILLWASNLYEFREPVNELPLREIPFHLKSLLEQDRIKDYCPTEG